MVGQKKLSFKLFVVLVEGKAATRDLACQLPYLPRCLFITYLSVSFWSIYKISSHNCLVAFHSDSNQRTIWVSCPMASCLLLLVGISSAKRHLRTCRLASTGQKQMCAVYRNDRNLIEILNCLHLPASPVSRCQRLFKALYYLWPST